MMPGLKWIDFEDLTPGTGQFNFQRQKADGFPVGFPEPELFTGATGDKVNQLRTLPVVRRARPGR